jgi:hypothetical protein
VTEYLLEKSRIVTHAPEERNYHVFYELLAGLPEDQRLKYGLMSAEKYFYLNQGWKSQRKSVDCVSCRVTVVGFLLGYGFLNPQGLHCKDKIPTFQSISSQNRNIGVSVPISTFMRL